MPLERIFLKSAEAKEKILSDRTVGERGHAAMKRLLEADLAGGTIYSAGTGAFRIKAAHFYEELACRYTAGAPFGRPDRGKIRGESLGDKPEDLLVETVRSIAGVRHAFVFFSGSNPKKEEAEAVRAAKGGGAYVLVMAGEGAKVLSEEADDAFLIPSDDAAVLCSVQSTLIHALCEGFEPEYLPADEGNSSVIGRRRAVFPESLAESVALDRSIAENVHLLNSIKCAHDEMEKRACRGARLYFAGNGGSAADALELYGQCCRRKLPDGKVPRVKHFLDPCFLTCAYNDGYSPFAREIERESKEDVLLVYSTSGKSENINKAVQAAKDQGIFTIGLTGKDGGELAKIADISIIVPSKNTGRIQEVHSLIGALLLPGVAA